MFPVAKATGGVSLINLFVLCFIKVWVSSPPEKSLKHKDMYSKNCEMHEPTVLSANKLNHMA